MKVCRICLSKDGRLYSITSNGLRSLYHQLTGLLKLETDVDKKLPQWVCAECGVRLLSYNKLRQKSLRAHQILCQLLDRLTQITEVDLNQIDRENNDLKSNLSRSAIQIIPAHVAAVKKPEQPDSRPELKINEFNAEVEVLKTEPSESEFFDDLEELPEDSLSDVKKSRKTILPKSAKTRRKKSQSDIENIDKKYNKKITKTVLKKEIRKTVREKKSKKEVNKDSDPFVDIFNIKILSFEEQMSEFEKRKHSPKYTNAPFQCDKCFRGFSAEVTFTRHQLTHTDKWGKFECKICKRRFRTINSYCEHMRAHKSIYSCKECVFKTGVRHSAKLHWSRHKGTVYKCPHCDLEFVNQNSYLLHLRVKHVSQFVCEYCGFSFVNTKGVDLHKKLKHSLEMETNIVSADSPACATCNIKFVSDEALNTHIEVSHPQNPSCSKRNDISIIRCRIIKKETKAYPCRICGKEFTKSTNRSRHMIIHTGLRPFLCETCGSSFKTQGEVKAHNEHVHLKVPWPKKQAKGSRHGYKK